MTPGSTSRGRQAGLLLPLFSCPSTSSWGIGEFADVPAIAEWMRGAGFEILLVLPLNEVTPGERSPYSSASSMALDPVFISVPAVAEFQAIGGEAALDAGTRASIARARDSRCVLYESIRAAKDRALRLSFDRFVRDEWTASSPRAHELRLFVDEQRWWLDEYALFRALHHAHGEQDWRRWPEEARTRDRKAIDRIRRHLDVEVRYRQYLQWIAYGQWQAARAAARNISVFGDLPFGVAGDSADTWANQDMFAFDGTIGAPPDAFSENGQNWGLPTYQWDAMAACGYHWFRQRARRARDLYDGFRVDHVVGLFRTWVFPVDGSAPHFVPAKDGEQRALGKAVLRAIVEEGGEVVAEDLGTIPDFVREELRALGVPGYKVLRWEREWDLSGQPFKDPAGYTADSLATSGTHDTDTLAAWWGTLATADRASVMDIPIVRNRFRDQSGPGDAGQVVDALLEALYASGSDLMVLPMQDVFGWTDRINVPAVVDDHNWTWKLPWAADHLDREPQAIERQALMHRLAVAYGRA